MSFISNEHKRKFLHKYRILFAVFILLQMLVLMAGSYEVWSGGRIAGKIFPNYDLVNAFKFQNQDYLLLYQESFGNSTYDISFPLFLYRVHDERLTDLESDARHLLGTAADERGVWLIYDDIVVRYNGQEIQSRPLKYLPPFSDLFIFNKNPTAAGNGQLYMLYEDMDKWWLAAFEGLEQLKPREIPCIKRCRTGCNEPKKTCPDEELKCGSMFSSSMVFHENEFLHFAVHEGNLYVQTIENGSASQFRKIGTIEGCCIRAGYDSKGLFVMSQTKDRSRYNFYRLKDGGISNPAQFTNYFTPLFLRMVNSKEGKAHGYYEEFHYKLIPSINRIAIADEKSKPQAVMKSYIFIVLMAFYPSLILLGMMMLLGFLAIAEKLVRGHKSQLFESSQGVSFEHPGIKRRADAFCIDILFLGALLVAGFYFTPFSLYDSTDLNNFCLFALPVWLAFSLLYLSIPEAEWGTTLGKLLLGIRVRDKSGGRPGLFKALIRNILLPIDALFAGAVGVTSILYSDRWQRLGDRVAGTIVVRKK